MFVDVSVAKDLDKELFGIVEEDDVCVDLCRFGEESVNLWVVFSYAGLCQGL